MWWVAVIPATQEAEVGELLEPGEAEVVQWAESAPLPSSLGDRARLCLNNNNVFLLLFQYSWDQ